MLEFIIFIESQLNINKICNATLLSRLAQLPNGKMCAFYYLSYSCQIGYYQQVIQILEDSQHKELIELLPN